MALETKTSEPIEGVTYKVTQLPFKDARRLFMRLARIFGPSLATLAEGVKSVDDLPLASMVTKAVENLSDRDLDEVSDMLAEVTQYSVDGQKWPPLLFKGDPRKPVDNRDDLFGGSLTSFFRWLWFALEVQFGDFSKALGKRSASDPASEGQKPDDTRG